MYEKKGKKTLPKNVGTTEAVHSRLLSNFYTFDYLLILFTRFKDKKVIIPEGAGIAVLKGAVIFGHDPSAISERKCR